MDPTKSLPILYERPSVPDNQTSGLRPTDLANITASNGPAVPYSSLLLDVLPLIQQIAAILCFVAVFFHLHQGTWTLATYMLHACSPSLMRWHGGQQAYAMSTWSEQGRWPSMLAPGSY